MLTGHASIKTRKIAKKSGIGRNRGIAKKYDLLWKNSGIGRNRPESRNRRFFWFSQNPTSKKIAFLQKSKFSQFFEGETRPKSEGIGKCYPAIPDKKKSILSDTLFQNFSNPESTPAHRRRGGSTPAHRRRGVTDTFDTYWSIARSRFPKPFAAGFVNPDKSSDRKLSNFHQL